MDRVVAVHQPNFFPWLGWFDKLARADVFVVLDDAQYPKKQGTWMNRVQVLVAGEPAWITMPVDRAYHGLRSIREIRVGGDIRLREKLTRTVEMSYRRSPHFGEAWPVLEPLLSSRCDSLCEYNLSALRTLAARLGLDTGKLRLASQLGGGGVATERLVSLVGLAGGSVYLYGGGAGGYQEDDKLRAAGIEPRPQKFEPRPYRQFNRADFVPGLSVIDAVMNLGFEGTGALLGASPK